jgi:hypothetical protein
MIAKSTRSTTLLLLAGLFSCMQPTSNSDDINPSSTPRTGFQAKAKTVIPIIITGIIAATQTITHDKPETVQPLPELPPTALPEPVSIADLKELPAPPVQTFAVDLAQDTVITCQQGTKVYLPAHVFEGAPDSIEVSVQEYYSKTDYISGNLSTVSNGRILESGGSIKITATAEDGRELEVKEGQSFAILFPKNTDGEMETFYGEYNSDSVMNWVSAEPAPTKCPNFDNEGFEHRFFMVDNRQTAQEKNWRFAAVDEPRNLFQYFYEEFNCLEQQPVNDAYAAFNGKDFDGMQQQFCYDVSFDQSGKIAAIALTNVHDGNAPDDMDVAIREFLLQLPPLNLKKNLFNYANGWGTPSYQQSICIYVKTALNKTVYKNEFRERYKEYDEELIEKIPSGDLYYFILSSTETGWINCDRYADVQGKPTTLVIENPAMRNTRYYLIFENFNAMVVAENVTINGCSFPLAPMGEPVKLIAISYQGAQPFMSMQQFVIGEAAISVNDFQPFSIRDLEAVLN